ncbi:nucleoside hydrolase [Paenisporosarcina quisquiliarum]|uniref:Nucleoside hydrolase n=1 Tax=Paenisporosarcina quisquiliarum TaxID=365346 RepID=A0A9X3LI53_9BACL|nr:nucleoside hydrolase [Paenisporosarcina quisquiliarum]
MKKVLFFGDIGIDDTIALIYAYLHDEIEIVGVVAEYGNVSREDAISNIHYIFNLFEFPKDIPVILGADVPLTGEQPTYYPEIHGEHGLGPIIPNNRVQVVENFYEIVKIIEQHRDELVIVNVGRLTSLATMFILYKDLMNSVKEFYIMGGVFWIPGNVTTVAEANFHADPVAVKIVLTYAKNVTVIPLNATQKAIVTPEMVDYIDQFGKAKILKPLMEFYTDFYKKRNPSLTGGPLHDVLTLMATIQPELFIFGNSTVEIVQRLEGPARGQSIADLKTEQLDDEVKKHRIAFDIDYNQFFSEFISVMIGQKTRNGEQ